MLFTQGGVSNDFVGSQTHTPTITHKQWVFKFTALIFEWIVLLNSNS